MAWAYFTVHTVRRSCRASTTSCWCPSVTINATRSYPRGSLDVGRQLKTSLARATSIRATGLMHEGTASTSQTSPAKLDGP
eukprot:scaffold36024_cov75-Phaeocystis_antarctica.AAC.2